MELDDVKLHTWIVRLAVGAGIVVGMLSWINGISLGWLIFRIVLTFVLIYFLCEGSMLLFTRNAPERAEDISLDDQKLVHNEGENKGSILDIALGDDDAGVPLPAPGQVNASLSSGTVTSEQQAEIVRRMGWENT